MALSSENAASAPDAASAIAPRADAVLRFWFGEDFARAPPQDAATTRQKLWFGGGPEFDKECKELFEKDLEDAAAGKLDSWKSGYDGLAAVILMDQMSRNIYRGSAQSFALDPKALQLSKQIHDGGSATAFPAVHRVFLYMPLMHSEHLEDLELCVQRFQELWEEAKALPDSEALVAMLANNVKYAAAHRQVVRQWGRFPHRNEVLGRQNTPEEEVGLQNGTIAKF